MGRKEVKRIEYPHYTIFYYLRFEFLMLFISFSWWWQTKQKYRLWPEEIRYLLTSQCGTLCGRVQTKILYYFEYFMEILPEVSINSFKQMWSCTSAPRSSLKQLICYYYFYPKGILEPKVNREKPCAFLVIGK